MAYELVVVWQSGEQNVYPYFTEGEARRTQQNMKMAFGNRISWSGVRESWKFN